MKIPFLKKKKENTPKIETLREPIFDVDKKWQILLFSFFASMILLIIIGFWLAYSIYQGNYSENKETNTFKEIIKETRLKNAINLRDEFMNQEIVQIIDPSI